MRMAPSVMVKSRYAMEMTTKGRRRGSENPHDPCPSLAEAFFSVSLVFPPRHRRQLLAQFRRPRYFASGFPNP